jgi:phage-related protein
MAPQVKKIIARFYVSPESEPPIEPARDWLLRLPKGEMTEIGQDIRVVEMNWPNLKDVKPKLIDYLGNDIWEVRSKLENRIARVLFAVEGKTMLLLHAFIKKQQATPKHDKDLALDRLKKAQGIK